MVSAPTKRSSASFKDAVARAAQKTAEQQRERNQVPSVRSSSQRSGSKQKAKAVTTSRRTATGSLSKSTTGKIKTTKRTASKQKKEATQTPSAEGNVAQRFLAGLGKGAHIALGAAAVLVVICIVLYPVGKDYYTSLRNEQSLEAELAAVEERNSQIESQNEALNTDEGVENQARSELGWVKKGEKSVSISNAGEDTDTATTLPSQVEEGSGKAPNTWYYTILDAVFGVNS